MEYISVGDAAAKFALSPRRVQMLCEQGRINGAIMLSGVWLIPKDAPKPQDMRRKAQPYQSLELENAIRIANGKLSLQQACSMLSISLATGRNWVRLGKLLPNGEGTFDEVYISALLLRIQTEGSATLKQRRNKKQIKGIMPYDKYISSKENIAVVHRIINAVDAPLSETQLRLILASYALQRVLKKLGRPVYTGNPLLEFSRKNIDAGSYAGLIADILTGAAVTDEDVAAISHLSGHRLNYIANEDTLGAIYLSLRDMAERKASGAYYTPYDTVQLLVKEIRGQTATDHKKIYDPCCGTGNFLLSLSGAMVNPRLLYGQDIDELSVQICRLNVALAYDVSDIGFLYENIVCGDSLKNTMFGPFDIIIGNPPWGYDFSAYDTEHLLQTYKTASQRGMESYDVFLERGISLLSENGYLAFVLPEALLNVKTHRQVRSIILEKCAFRFVAYIGNAFKGVQCPAIILGLQLGARGETTGCKVAGLDDGFTIKKRRELSDEIFTFHIADEQQACVDAIEKVSGKVYLANNALFALGIVTGDNKKHISNERKVGYELILKGNDIFKYRIVPSNYYIQFTPEQFQQVAPTSMYRSPEKLLYRFICSTPVFAYDNSQTLSLNSCNMLIPNIPGMHIKYILAILNSRVAAYFIRMKFRSVKLLRSHIEQIPIPAIDERAQREIIAKVDQLLERDASIIGLYDELDETIMGLYGLAAEERAIIYKTVTQKNEFIL
ncbi:N-6 DNA methylase [Clostridia bacterium OttesenSCG-928-F22]|nr:N-6 DNA methylase [Clostridia bacterium OttesenSCG-928-F22]